jgi:hypothetical protein
LRRMRVAFRIAAVAVALALAAPGLAACEKSNEVVLQEQYEQAREGCPQGCIDPPPGCAIKGNISVRGNKFYHLPGRKSYPGIIIEPEKGERWFCSEAEALANGWMASQVP